MSSGGGGFFNQINPWGTGGGGAPWGHQGGGPGGRVGNHPRPQGPEGGRRGVSFEEDSEDYDFDQLGPPPAADITQTQGDAPAAGDILVPPAIPGGGGGGVNPPPPPPQQAGRGGGNSPPEGIRHTPASTPSSKNWGGKCTTRLPSRPSSQCS